MKKRGINKVLKVLQINPVVISREPLEKILPRLLREAPHWLNVSHDIWNIYPLHRSLKVKEFNIDFNVIKNIEVRAIGKAYCLHLIVDRRLGPQSIRSAWEVLVYLDRLPAPSHFHSISSDDFEVVERHIQEQCSHDTAARRCSSLAAFGQWLTKFTSLRISYSCNLRAAARHGRSGNDAGRAAKLLPDVVIQQLLAARFRPGLLDRDLFFLSATAISVCTGLRIEELMTLPSDCLIEEGDACIIRFFVSKNGKSVPRFIPPELKEVACEAIAYILEVTAEARDCARIIREIPSPSWPAILNCCSKSDMEYFVRRWLGDWLSNPFNRLIDTENVFYTPRGSPSYWFPLAAHMRAHGNNVSAVSRATGIGRTPLSKLIAQLEASRSGIVYIGNRSKGSDRAFDTDVRYPSISAFLKEVGYVHIKGMPYELVMKLVGEARLAMLEKGSFSVPDRNTLIEQKYFAKPGVLRDRHSGADILCLEDALFTVFKGQLSHCQITNMRVVTRVTKSNYSHWLSGYVRDRGSGKQTDSACARLGIIDPRTGDFAEFSHHDFRHWLSTAYENGGLSQVQIATLFNRKSVSGNGGYSQISVPERQSRLKEAMKDGLLTGHVPETYTRICEESPEEAAEFLESAIKFYNPMPHGVCRLNWAVEPCPHTLSCFSCGKESGGIDDLCEHLVLDLSDAQQIQEIDTVNRNAGSMMRVFEEEGGEASPQYEKFSRIRASTQELIAKAKKIE